MATYIVSYDLNREVRRPPIVEKIKDISNGWARLSESSYAIAYHGSPEAVLNQLKPMIDDDDNIYIISLSRPWTGYGPEKVNDWLNSNLS